MLVWIIHICPFVGTVTTLTEFILALIHNDYNEAKRKGLYTVVGCFLDVCSFAAGFEFFLLLVSTAIRGVIGWYQNVPFSSWGRDKGNKRNYAKEEVEWPKKEGNQNDKGDEESKGKKRKPHKDKSKSEKTNKRSKKRQGETRSARGEHVINVGVVTIYKDIAVAFLQAVAPDITLLQLVERECISRTMLVYHYIQSPIPVEIIHLIEHTLVVYILPETPYNNENAKIFGMQKLRLVNAVVEYMKAVHDGMNGDHLFRNIINIIEEFIREIYFVDHEALNALEQERIRDYENARGAVEEMLRLVLTRKVIGTLVRNLEIGIENWRIHSTDKMDTIK